MVSNAGISALRPLDLGKFAIIWTQDGLRIGKGRFF